MEKLYQTDWHGILFKSFARLSESELPSRSFYDGFYDAFFKKYANWDELNPSWKESKRIAAEFIIQELCRTNKKMVLSIGCGIGIIEKQLVDKGYCLDVTEISENALLWIRRNLTPDHVHVGNFPDCLPLTRLYDFIYLSAIDHCFNSQEFLGFLKVVKKRLAPGGVCLILSTAFKVPSKIWLFQFMIYTIKRYVNLLLKAFWVRKKNAQQFWGYIRTMSEFKRAMIKAEYSLINQGFLYDKSVAINYWIQGINSI